MHMNLCPNLAVLPIEKTPPIARRCLIGICPKRGLFAELLDRSPAILRVLLALGEELFGVLGIDDRELAEAGLLHDEVAELRVVRFHRSIDDEAGFALLDEARVVMEAIEVAAFDRLLFFLDRVDQAALDVLFGARAVADDEGRAVIGFGFLQGLDGFAGVGAESDLSNVDVLVGHRHEGEVLLGFFLTRGGELVDGTGLGGLGGLTTGVGVNLGVEDEDVDVGFIG